MVCHRVITSVVMLSLTLLATFSANVLADSRPSELFTLVAEPKVAKASQPRLITATGFWLDNCPPYIKDTIFEFGVSPSRFLIRLARPESLIACTPGHIPVSLTTTLVPSVLGELAVVLISPEGRELATTVLTGLSDDSIEVSRLSGLWFGLPEVNSLLVLESSKLQDGVLVGLWGLFARDGAPRWQTLHSSGRISSEAFEAKVVEYVAIDDPISCADIACPRSIVGENSIGTATLRLLPDDKLEIEIRNVKPPASTGTQPSSARFVLRKVNF
jgi:hypothetical protein